MKTNTLWRRLVWRLTPRFLLRNQRGGRLGRLLALGGAVRRVA